MTEESWRLKEFGFQVYVMTIQAWQLHSQPHLLCEQKHFLNDHYQPLLLLYASLSPFELLLSSPHWIFPSYSELFQTSEAF